ncbi:hypothetical protein AB1L30_02105 [Bremerella sp. JC817]|uniref:hypothetical protein n=1 Tax=Bremerella sp. JC817 TaxID=3231756 RepID=UPI0034581D68
MLSKRSQIGIVALLTLGLAGGMWLLGGETSNLGPFQAALLRIGVVMAVVWLAFPQISKLPIWLATIGIGSVLAILVLKKAAIIVIPLLILIWFLRPRPAKQANSISRGSSSSDR